MIDIAKDFSLARDFLGNSLEVGDRIVYMDLGYRSLKKGTIEKIAPKMLIIMPDDSKPTRWNKGTYRQYHNQVIKL